MNGGELLFPWLVLVASAPSTTPFPFLGQHVDTWTVERPPLPQKHRFTMMHRQRFSVNAMVWHKRGAQLGVCVQSVPPMHTPTYISAAFANGEVSIGHGKFVTLKRVNIVGEKVRQEAAQSMATAPSSVRPPASYSFLPINFQHINKAVPAMRRGNADGHHVLRLGGAGSRSRSTTRLILMALGSATVAFMTTSLMFMHNSPMVKKGFGPDQFIAMMGVAKGGEGKGVVVKDKKRFDKWRHKAAGAEKETASSWEGKDEGEEDEEDEEDENEEKDEQDDEKEEDEQDEQDEQEAEKKRKGKKALRETVKEEKQEDKKKTLDPEIGEEKKTAERHNPLGAHSTLSNSEHQGSTESQGKDSTSLFLPPTTTKKKTRVRFIPSAPVSETCQAYLEREDMLPYERDFAKTPIRVHQYGGG